MSQKQYAVGRRYPTRTSRMVVRWHVFDKRTVVIIYPVLIPMAGVQARGGVRLSDRVDVMIHAVLQEADWACTLEDNSVKILQLKKLP